MGLMQAGIEAILVEPGMVGATNARKRGIESVICSTLEDAGFVKAALPAAGMFDVLEHIEADAEALKDVREIIRPRGRIYLTVPAYNFLYSHEDHEAGHYRRYSATTLTKLLGSAGFSVEYFTYIFSFLPIPVYLFRTLPTRFGYRKQVTRDSAQQDHATPSRLAGRLMSMAFDLEIRRIRKKKTIPFGGSCLIVGRAE